MTSILTAVSDTPGDASERCDRWRPNRAGLVSVWRYLEETFEFHNGWLLLRGPNGSGKSMALELLLPFLLDADTSPNRLTSASNSRGGLFDRIMTGSDEPTRTGYVWVEFLRGAEVFTIGARMRASQSTRKVDVDYFTTTQSVGRDLHLLDDQRVPLSLKRLKEVLGEQGRVHGTAEEHRNAVREALYEGFGPDRYAAVVSALLALRKEKLSQNLDLDKLSDVMSEALPPIDEHDITAVAEGFERLDRRRDQLDALAADVSAVDALANRQRTYARHVVAWLGEEVRAAESRRDTVTRSAREAAERLRAEEVQRQALIDRGQQLDGSLRDARAQITGYRDSDAYREGSRLVELRRQLGERQRDVDRLAVALEQAGDRVTKAAQQVEEAERALVTCDGNLADARQSLERSALAAGSAAVVDEAVVHADPSAGTADAERLIAAHVASRRVAMAEVRAVLRMYERAQHERDVQAATVDRATEALDEAVDARRRASAALDAATATYVTEVEHWVAACRHLPSRTLRSALPADCSDPAAVVVALARVQADLRGEHEQAVGEIRRRQEELDAEHVELNDQREHFASGSLVEPLAPSWRDDRRGESGAPMWRSVDVVDGIDAGVIDAVEAALVAAGLVDAWIRPDGSVDLGRHDLTFVPAPLDGETLRSVLVPLDTPHLPGDLVERVLDSVRLVDTVDPSRDPSRRDGSVTDVVVGRDGTFRIGAAVGRGSVDTAALLGAEARERRRLVRLAEIDDLIAGNRHDHRRFGEQIETLERAWAATVAELQTAPSGVEVGATLRDVGAAEAREQECGRLVRREREQLEESEREVREGLRRLTAEAARHQVPTDPESLDDLGHALDALERAAIAWVNRGRERAAAAAHVVRERSEMDDATTARAGARDVHADFDRSVDELRARTRAVEDALGSDYDEILERIAALEQRCDDDEQERSALTARRPAIEQAIGRLKESVERSELEREAAEEHRSATHVRFVTSVRRGLTRDAGVDASGELDGVTAVLTTARDVAATIGAVDTGPQARDRASARVEEQLHAARQRLAGSDLEREPTDDGWSDLTALAGGQRRRIGDLAGLLRAKLDSAAAELRDEEEQLFARVLAGDIRRALAARIRHANELVGIINSQLEQVRTKAGAVQARLAWGVDDEQPDAVRSARALLLRDPSDLTEEQTVSLQAFVRARVEQARVELEFNAPWEARLRETLDYRRWHRFTLQIAHRDWEGFQNATPRRLQKLSTGERSIALHLPMLASIAAHYTAADGQPATCPRLILLDELFAGVDPSNRAQLFARFTDWDLDAIFTSDHEWCQYATLDGIAIHHLHPPMGDEPVTSTRFTWDGHRRSIDPPVA
jgi:uncharacterized protein (TIGR02680 family)